MNAGKIRASPASCPAPEETGGRAAFRISGANGGVRSTAVALELMLPSPLLRAQTGTPNRVLNVTRGDVPVVVITVKDLTEDDRRRLGSAATHFPKGRHFR